MTRNDDFNAGDRALQMILENGTDGLADAFRILLNEAMVIERSQALGAGPWERTEERVGHANGFKPKTLKTRLGSVTFDIPQTRGGDPFYPSALERGLRSERALTLAIAEIYLQGVSTRKVTKVLETLCGLEITSSEVSRAAAKLDESIARWRIRPIGETPYLLVDARYEKVRTDGAVVSSSVLVAVGIDTEGRREVLGVSVSLSEAEVHWREFFASLQERGMHGVRMITSDDHAGLKAARTARFPGVKWQRCQFHLQQNALHYVTRVARRKEVARDIRSVFNAPDRAEADRLLKIAVKKYREEMPRLADWMEENVPEGLTVFSLPEHHRRRLRTTNMLERLNKEIRRRTRVATLFPNEASVLRLVASILMETNDDWLGQSRYLNMSPDENQS
jgi:transposase-like protein